MAKVLVLEDDEIFGEMLRDTLIEMGHEAIVAGNGKLGMDLCSAHDFDVVLTDIVMPEMDGLEFIKEARKNGYNLGIVAISGDKTGNVQMLVVAKKLGANLILEKPFGRDDLKNALKEIVG